MRCSKTESQANSTDAISGETVLGYLAQNRTDEYAYSLSDMFYGFILDQSEKPLHLILLGGLFLIFAKNWRIMLSGVLGAFRPRTNFQCCCRFWMDSSYSKFYSLMAFLITETFNRGWIGLWYCLYGKSIQLLRHKPIEGSGFTDF